MDYFSNQSALFRANQEIIFKFLKVLYFCQLAEKYFLDSSIFLNVVKVYLSNGYLSIMFS